MKRGLGLLLALAVSGTQLMAGRAKKLAAADTYCEQLKAEFRETLPYVFSGPDPWVKLDEMPATWPDQALAYVYAEGPNVRWVVLQVAGPRHTWLETVNYFFALDGSLVKRERYLDEKAANTSFAENRYYEGGRLLKEHTEHHALGPGREDSGNFDDPDAPDYRTVSDLPFPDEPDFWKQLAAEKEPPRAETSTP
jgi:hypothetical protein